MKNKVLIIGSSGMLGKDLTLTFHNNGYEVYGVDLIEDSSNHLHLFFKTDLATDHSIFNIVESVNPTLIIYVAAIVSLNTCEENKKLADIIHHTLPARLAACKADKTKFIYISTDSVFDGTKGDYSETDKKNPLNYYAESKSNGEDEIMGIPNCIVVRTNIFGFNIPLKSSLVEWAIDNFQNKREITGFEDLLFNAIYTKDLAHIIESIWNETVPSVLNIAAKGAWSKYDFLYALCNGLGYDISLLKRGNSKNINFTIKRPLNTTLNTSRIEQITNIPTIEESLSELCRNYLNLQL